MRDGDEGGGETREEVRGEGGEKDGRGGKKGEERGEKGRRWSARNHLFNASMHGVLSTALPFSQSSQRACINGRDETALHQSS